MDYETGFDRKTMLIGAVIAALALLAIGILLGRTLLAPAVGVADAEEHGDETEHAEGMIEMDAERASSAGIVVQTVSAGSLGSEIVAQAMVVPAPNGEAVLTARADGAVVRIAKRLGDTVNAGEAIAWLESREAAAIAADHGAALAKLALARSNFAREQQLFDAGVTSRQDLEAAQAAFTEAEAELQRAKSALGASQVSSDGRALSVTSLISGRVTWSDVRLGDYVSAGTELFRVVDPRRLQVQASVVPADARSIARGDRAAIELDDGTTVGATVRSVTPSLDPESRVATLVLIPDDAAPLTPGQGLRVRITPRGNATGSAIVLPEEAVQSVGGRNVVFVKTGEGFLATPVTVGQRSAGRIEIVAGLRPGSSVATRGAFLLKAELGKGEAEHRDD